MDHKTVLLLLVVSLAYIAVVARGVRVWYAVDLYYNTLCGGSPYSSNCEWVDGATLISNGFEAIAGKCLEVGGSLPTPRGSMAVGDRPNAQQHGLAYCYLQRRSLYRTAYMGFMGLLPNERNEFHYRGVHRNSRNNVPTEYTVSLQ